MRTNYDYLTFISRYTGKRVDYDHVYENQCVDLWKQFCADVDIPVQRCPDNYAQSYWTHRVQLGYGTYFDFITDKSQIRPGDWLIWLWGSSCRTSHIGMAVSKVSGGYVTVFGQNQGHYLAACNQMRLPADFAGALRYKGYKKQSTLITTSAAAQSFNKNRAGTYIATANVNIRRGPSTNYASMGILKKGGTANCYGYYTGGWLYVIADGKTGFVYSEYLKKPAAKAASVKVGSKIRIRSGAAQYGKTVGFAAHVYKTVYKVTEISGDRVVFALGNIIIGAVRKSDCIVQ